MNVPTQARFLDERFFDRRRRSTSIGGIAGAMIAAVLFLYRHYVNHVWNWDVFAVLAAIAIVKMCVMAWYYVTDSRGN